MNGIDFCLVDENTVVFKFVVLEVDVFDSVDEECVWNDSVIGGENIVFEDDLLHEFIVDFLVVDWIE